LSEPTDEHDLTFDWRALIDGRSRMLVEGGAELVVDALANAREAFQACDSRPLLRVDSDLPLPLAVLVGFEWRITTRLRLELLQRTGSSFDWIPASGPTAAPPVPTRTSFARSGPTVVFVSCRNGAIRTARRYADEVGAAELVELHVHGLLEPDAIRGLARAGAAELAAAADQAREKHLIIAGPATLAFLIGAAANALGEMTVPFWNGSAYVSPITLGATDQPTGGRSVRGLNTSAEGAGV
jgi:hypothetical protein